MEIGIVINSLDDAKTLFLDQSILKNDNLLYELRIDLDNDLLKIVSDPTQFPFDIDFKKLIVTLRSKSEGGDFSGDRRAKFLEIIDIVKSRSQKIGYLDLEFDNDREDLKKANIWLTYFDHLIISRHDYTGSMQETLSKFINDLQEILSKSNASSQILKFVGYPKDPLDTIEALRLSSKIKRPKIILGIGKHGILSRTMGRSFNQYLIFGTIDPSTKLPSIPKYSDLIQISANKETPLFTGLLGISLDHSISPLIHKILRIQTGKHGYYHLFEFDDGKRALKFLRMLPLLPIKGLNVTFPYKTAVLDAVDNKTEETVILNAANTLEIRNGKIIAHNTDVLGFQYFFEEINKSHYQNIVIFGAGGAARAVGLALIKLDKKVTFVNRTSDRYNQFTDIFHNKCDLRTLEGAMEIEADVYINATTLGYDSISPTSVFPFPKGTKIVIDLNYHLQNETILVQKARKLGFKAYDGKKMLLYQAKCAYEIWTGNIVNDQHLVSAFNEKILGSR